MDNIHKWRSYNIKFADSKLTRYKHSGSTSFAAIAKRGEINRHHHNTIVLVVFKKIKDYSSFSGIDSVIEVERSFIPQFLILRRTCAQIFINICLNVPVFLARLKI